MCTSGVMYEFEQEMNEGEGGVSPSQPKVATRKFSKPTYEWDHYSGLPGVEAYKEKDKE